MDSVSQASREPGTAEPSRGSTHFGHWTGREARLAAAGATDDRRMRLRFGSNGTAVKALQ